MTHRPKLSYTVKNNGTEIHQFDVSYKIDDEPTVTQTIIRNFGTGGYTKRFTIGIASPALTVGEHTIVLSVSNPDGVTDNEDDNSKTIHVIVEPLECDQITEFPYIENFDNGIPECWLTIDNNHDTITWIAASDVTANVEGFRIYDLVHNNTGDAVTIWSFYRYNNYLFGNIDINLDDYLISPEILIPEAGAKLSFWAKNYQSLYPESYTTYISNGSINMEDFVQLIPLATPDDIYQEVIIDIPPRYNGQIIRIIFHIESYDNWGMGIDDFSIIANPTDIEETIASTISVFPNPANNLVTITNVEGHDITIINSLGQVVASVENASSEEIIDVSKFVNGTYFVKVAGEVERFNVVR